MICATRQLHTWHEGIFPLHGDCGSSCSQRRLQHQRIWSDYRLQSGPDPMSGRNRCILRWRTICRVRTGPGTGYATKSRKKLTVNARGHAYSNGTLKKGTRVTCKDVRKVGSDIWIKIPSGWIAAYYGEKEVCRIVYNSTL